ncbi:MAG: tRNA uridine-5-carboxymethylaminomethyl(34) synthesis GTPase MnmE [Syntrophomonadaceae bacterium]|nr:tRNA uridine-5-carboxymethylaminomethyl(34) synthesis GTPase MnmE [Syntrophomonadaceae bacterium]
MYEDDIAAISTPPGEGGIAIVRLSGNGVIEKMNPLFRPRREGTSLAGRPSHTLTLGWIIDDRGEIIDEVLVGIMKCPRSYTGEDVVEINCHGGSLPARRCLERVLSAGFRLAEPGEFTRRAYLNGRLDISQAEAVIDIIRAKSDKGMRLAQQQLSGMNFSYIANLEDGLTRINAMIEASIDFPDEVGEPDYDEVEGRLQEILSKLDSLINAARRAEVYREGISIAICGKPNVGKSTLLNTLLRKEKAIVTEIPGTTRDVIEDYINVRGIPVKIMDTAGIRFTEDQVEKIGVERSREAIKAADLVLFLLDVETGITAEDREIFSQIHTQNIIVMVNKEDLIEKKIDETSLKGMFPGLPIIRGSAREEIGIDELEESIEKLVLSGQTGSDNLEIMVSTRQRSALERARQQVLDTRDGLREAPLDCLGVDLGGAMEALGEITGKNLKEEAIDRIFHDFCIGK